MAEKQYKYTAKIKQPQTVGNIKLEPNGGLFSEREYKALKKDAYGASLLEKGLLIVEEVSAQAPATPAPSDEAEGDITGETIHDFDQQGWNPPK